MKSPFLYESIEVEIVPCQEIMKLQYIMSLPSVFFDVNNNNQQINEQEETP